MARIPDDTHPLHNAPAGDGVIRLALLDDQLLLVQSLRLLFNREPGLTVVGAAGTIAEGYELLALTRPDIVLLDVVLPDGDGLERLHCLRSASPTSQFVVLSARLDEATLLRAVEAGVSGFVSKHQPANELLEAIRRVAAGDMAMPANLLLRLVAARLPAARPGRVPASHPHSVLTAREREILALAAEGLSSAEMAASLTLSVQTIRTHLRNAIGKLNAHSRLEAVAIALRTGLLAPPT